MKVIALFALSLLASRAFANATQVYVKCQDDSGVVKLATSYPGDMFSATADLTVGEKRKTYLDSSYVQMAEMNYWDLKAKFPLGYEIASIAGVEELDLKVLTVAVVKDDWVILQLSADPATLQVTEKPNGRTAEFKARLRGEDPRNDEELSLMVNCTYQYLY